MFVSTRIGFDFCVVFKFCNSAVNDIVIKCFSGMASSVCVAIDTLFRSKMLGTIAGEDTIFIVTHSEREAKLLALEIKEICKG